MLRAGYSCVHPRRHAGTLLYANNPGGYVNATRNMTLGTLVYGDTSKLPLLLRDGTSQLGPPTVPGFAVVSDRRTTRTQSAREFYPEAQMPAAHSFNVSLQRQLTKDMAVDVRSWAPTSADGGPTAAT